MRLIFLTVFICLVYSCKPYTKLDGIYFSNRQDCFSINGKENAIESKSSYVIDRLTAKQNRRTIKFFKSSRSRLLPFLQHRTKYTFRVAYNSEDSFIIEPRSRIAKEYYDHRHYIVFKSKYSFADPLVFDSIIFHSSRCFGTCHDLHMKIDKYGSIKVTDNGDGHLDTLRNGNYIGQLSTMELERLYRILKYSHLRTMEWPQRKCFDAPVLTLIVYTPWQCYYFKAMDFCAPMVSWELNSFLSKQFFHKSLKKVSDQFLYEE